MIRPILACVDPYKAAEEFAAAGWNIDFSQSPESGDPLVGVSLYGNSVLLGVTEGYVADNHIQHIGCGVVIYMTVPTEQIKSILSFYHNCTQRRFISRMYRYKQKNTEKNLLRFFSVFIFCVSPFCNAHKLVF